MKSPTKYALPLAALIGAGVAVAAGADLGQAEKQATNWTAIAMFAIFVLFTLWITKWAAAKTKSAADFYTAGGGITGFQNGLARRNLGRRISSEGEIEEAEVETEIVVGPVEPVWQMELFGMKPTTIRAKIPRQINPWQRVAVICRRPIGLCEIMGQYFPVQLSASPLNNQHSQHTVRSFTNLPLDKPQGIHENRS